MIWLLLLIAIVAGLALMPGKPLHRAGVIVPEQGQMKRIWQGILFGAMILLLLSLRLFPFALLLLLVAVGVIGNGWWQERAIGDDLQDKPDEAFKASEQPSAYVNNSKMSVKEAYEVLGLEETASRVDVNAAYKRLMSQIHPDKGGTDYLAAKLNEARELLLAKMD